MNTRRLLSLAALTACVACSDAGPVSGPGRMTATLVSPNGAEGAAVIVLVGEGVGDAVPVGGVQLFRNDEDGATRLVLVSPGGGDLAFEVDVADTTHLPVAIIEQVAGPDDGLRADPSGYRLELRR
jgi:hypothetical protein